MGEGILIRTDYILMRHLCEDRTGHLGNIDLMMRKVGNLIVKLDVCQNPLGISWGADPHLLMHDK